MRRRLLASFTAVALVSLLIGVAPQPVVAECFPRPPAGNPIPIAYAFAATVVDLSTKVDQEAKDAGEGDGLVWQMELQVDDVYRGSVPARLSLTGYTLSHRSCSYFLGEQTHVGDKLFVAVDDQVNLESNTSLFGELLLWHRVDDRLVIPQRRSQRRTGEPGVLSECRSRSPHDPTDPRGHHVRRSTQYRSRA